MADKHYAQNIVAMKAMWTTNYRVFKELHTQLPESTHEMQDGMSAIRHWQGERFWIKTDMLARIARIFGMGEHAWRRTILYKYGATSGYTDG